MHIHCTGIGKQSQYLVYLCKAHHMLHHVCLSVGSAKQLAVVTLPACLPASRPAAHAHCESLHPERLLRLPTAPDAARCPAQWKLPTLLLHIKSN